MRAPHALHGRWRHSHPVSWQLAAAVVLAAYRWLAAAGLTDPRGPAAPVPAPAFTAAAVGQLGHGAARAERARRHGCWRTTS